MAKWLIVVIGWGIVGPVLAIEAIYVPSWGAGKRSWDPGCRALKLTASSGLAPGSTTLYGYSLMRPHIHGSCEIERKDGSFNFFHVGTA